MEKVQRKRKKDDERHERKKGKKESTKSSLSAASDSNNTAASRRSPLDASTEKNADVSTTSTNQVDGNAGEEVKDNVDAKDKDSDACMRQSPEPNCSICLSKLENKSFTDSCFHTFCFVCLLEWSKIKTECPLCKQPFKSIIHNVRSYDDYDQYDVQKQDMPDERRFRYRTTLTVDRLLALQTPRGEIQDNIYGPRSHMTTRHSSRRLQQQQQQQQQQQIQQQQQHHHHRWQYSRHSLEFRRSVYRNNLQIVKGRNVGHYRNTKPDFLQKNPAVIHRLAPWLERELNVLLRHQESHVPFVMELILDLIKYYPINSEEFYQHILPFVGRNNTSHFMHEFENFARSTMPDVRSYDENTQYVPFTQLVDSNTDASSTDDDDDDVIVLSPRETTTATATATTSGSQSSISVSISLGHPSQQIVMTSSSWDKQSSDKSQTESSTSNGQNSTSGWESPQPGPSGVLQSSIMESTNAATESTSAETCPALESTSKPETSKLRQLECSSDSNASDANGEGDNNVEEDDSDVVITGYEKPWAERSPILISDLDDGSDEEEEAEQVAEKSEEANLNTRSSASESHRSGEGSIKRSNSQQKERAHRKSRQEKYSSSSSHSKDRRRREHNLRSSNATSFETTLYNKKISSRSRSKSRSGSRSRHSKSKSSSSSYSTKERRSRRQRHRDDSPTSSSSSLQLHISQRSIFCPLFNSNVCRVGNHPRRTLTEHSSSACEYESYSHTRSHRKHRSSYTPASPVRHPSRARSRSSSVEIIACKRQRRSHKKHKKHKHRKHHRSKHSSKVSSSACGSVSDSNFASGGSDVVPISPPPASMYKKHHSGYKNSHLKQRVPTSPSTDDVHIIATVRGERSYLDSFQKYTNSLRPTSSTATASCSQSSFKERVFPMSPLGSHPSSPIIDAETIGADVVIPSEGNGCPIGLEGSEGDKASNAMDMLTKTISLPVSTYGTLDEINDPDLKLMIPDLMVMQPQSPSSPSARKSDCMQTNSNTSTTLTSASQIGLSSCGLDSSKWLPLSLSAEQSSPPANPDCRYGGKNPGDFCPFIGQVDRGNPDTSKPSATVTLASANGSKSLSTSNSNSLNIVSSVFESSLMSSDSNSSSSSAISVTDHEPITHRIKPFSMSPTTSLEPGPSTSMASFQPLAFDDHDITTPMSSTHQVDTLNHWTSPEKGQTASGAEQQSDHGSPCSSKVTSSTSLLDTLSTVCSTSAALSLTSPERKAREEAVCTDNDIQSIISEVFALNSQSDIIPPQREVMGSIRSPSPSLKQGEKTPNSGNDNNYQAQSPTPTKGKLLIDMGDGNRDKKSDNDDDNDYSDSDSSSSNLTPILDKNRMQHPQQPEGASSSTSEAMRRKMISSPSSPSSSDNKSQADGLYEYSSLNLSSNKKSPLKLTFKRLKPVQDSTPENPSESQASQPSASSSRSGFSSDSESSNQADHCRTQTSSGIEPAQKSPASKESAPNTTFSDYLMDGPTKTNSPEKKPEPDSPTEAPKNLFDESSSDESNVQSCKDPDFPGLPSSAAVSPPQASKPLGSPVDNQVSKPASQESPQVEGHSEESSSGSDDLDGKNNEGSNHGTDYKMIRSSELHSQGDVSDEFHSGIDEDDPDFIFLQ